MNVPKLRFKEFNDEWLIFPLNKIVKFSKGNLLSKADLDDEGLYPCILYGQLYTKYSEVIRNIFSKTNRNDKNLILSKYGDILIPSSGETPIDISTSSCVMVENVILGGDINILSPVNCDGRFLSYMINNNKKKEIAKVAQGHSVVHLYNDNLKKINVNIPSLTEQTKIANTLELLDKKIELQTKKIEDLKLFKKGLIKDIFSADNLKSVYIKDLGTVITGTTPSKDNKNYWDNGFIAWITPTDITYDRDISTSITSLTEVGLDKGRYVPKNSVLVTCIASIGKNAVLKVDGSCNQQINAIIPNNNYKSNYIYYLMEYISPYLQSIAGTSATAIVNKETFENVKVNVHSFSEQLKIDKYLSSIESKILLEYKLLNKLFELKKGLMQNMFV